MLLRRPHWIKLASLLRGDGSVPRPIEDRADEDECLSSGPFNLLEDFAALAGPSDNCLLLLDYAARFDIDVEIFDAPGAFLAMANIAPMEANSERVTTSGKGFNGAKAILACLGEAAEISSWICRASDIPSLLDGATLGHEKTIDAAAVLGFSTDQIKNRHRLNKSWHGWDRIPPAAYLEKPMPWAPVQSFYDDRAALSPAFLCYGRFGDVAHGDATLNVDSNGCAAGPTQADARARALLELVERDATGIWWNRGCVRTRMEIASLDDPMLMSHALRHRQETGRRLWLLDISSFRNVKVSAAISCEDSGEQMAVGFGAGFSMTDAARSSFLELVQSEAAMQAHDERLSQGPDTIAPADDCRMTRWKRFADVRNFRFAIGKPTGQDEAPCLRTVDSLLDEIRTVCGQDVWFAELSRPEIELPVTKAICQGLSHFKPRWGCRRNATAADGSTRQIRGLSQARKLLI